MRSACLVVVLFVLSSPAQDKAPLSRIAFGSCLNQDRPQPIWTPLLASRPQMFLFLGDNIYADTDDMTALRKMYAQLGDQPGYKKLKAMCPILATWDDHDYGKNDAGVEYPKKKESQQVFLDFFGVAKDDPRRKQEGVYSARVFGPEGKRVQIILLDTRYHRSELKKGARRGLYVPNDDPEATMLGKGQWAWLREQLKVAAEVRLIGASVQVIAEEHPYEKWANLPRERERLFNTLRESKANGVIILSGDRHLAELSMADVGIGYPLYDLTASGMNMANRRFRKLEANRHRVAIMDQGDHFGMVRIDWTKEDPIIGLEIHDADGDVTIRHKVPLSRLQVTPGKVKAPGEGKDLAAEAMKLVGKEWTVEYVVAAVGSNSGKTMYYLNSEKDFRNERNFVTVLDMKALGEALKKVGDPRKHFLGKKVKVTGTVSLFRERPQIMVKMLEQVKEVEK